MGNKKITKAKFVWSLMALYATGVIVSFWAGYVSHTRTPKEPCIQIVAVFHDKKKNVDRTDMAGCSPINGGPPTYTEQMFDTQDPKNRKYDIKLLIWTDDK